MTPPPPSGRPWPERSPHDKPEDIPDFASGPKAYLNYVYRERHGGRAPPSEANTIRAEDVIRQHLQWGPLPTPKLSFNEQQEPPSSESVQLKVPKRRSRSQSNASAEEGEREDWESARKIATQKLKMPVPGPAKKVDHRTSASFDHAEKVAPTSPQSDKNAAEEQAPKSGKQTQRNVSERRKTVHGDEIPQSVSKDVDKAFDSAYSQLVDSRSPTAPPPLDVSVAKT